MKTDHTPGPWEVRRDAETAMPYIGTGPYVIVESVYNTTGKQSEQEANARLIAAAPELLEACRMAKEYLIRDVVEPGRTVFWALIDALKKAEGRA